MVDTDGTMALEEMLREARIEPDKEELVHEGSEDLPIERMTAKKIGVDGHVLVYDTKTNEPSKCNYNMLRAQLKKKHADGSSAFTTIKPKEPPKRGNWKCLLHAENQDRPYYDGLGLPICMKSNLTNEYMVTRHMQKRHRDEWAAIDAMAKKKEKDEDRAFQRALMGGKAIEQPEALSASNGDEIDWDNVPVYESPNPKPRKKKK